MSKVFIEIWFKGDVGPATIFYFKKYRGDSYVAHERFTREATLNFPNAEKIKVTQVF